MGKLITVPAELSKISNVVDNNIVEKIVYVKIFAKVNIIDKKVLFGELFSKIEYDLDKQNFEVKNEDVDGKTLLILIIW